MKKHSWSVSPYLVASLITGVALGRLVVNLIKDNRRVKRDVQLPEGYPKNQGAVSEVTGGHPEAMNEM